MSPPTSVSPEATFIAASAASQIVTNDHDSHADTWYDQHGFQPSGDPVMVSAPALQLLNNFLDHLLFNFLAQSGSTKLPTLRPAVSEVLKPKLAKDAINNADEELREYLGGGDDEEFLQTQPAPAPRDWDLELVWKRTRLRCMVYSSLGDMEEEDEDHHVEEGLLTDDDENFGGSVSPAVAIFLTSILEFLAEQALISAGQAAWNRMRVKYEKEQKDGARSRTDVIERIVVEEVDMERVALDRTLGRLWRAWKKRIRCPVPNLVDLSQGPKSREKVYQLRRGSATAESAVPPVVQEHVAQPVSAKDDESHQEKATAEPDDVQAAAIPLPMGERDVDEIEVPGLVHYSDGDTEEEEPKEPDTGVRPKSLMLLPVTSKADLPTPTMSQPQTPKSEPRKRSNSLPSPVVSPKTRKNAFAVVADATQTPQATDRPHPEQPVNGKIIAREAAEVQTARLSHVISDEEKPPIGEKNARRQSGGLIPKIVGGMGAAATGVGAGTAATASKGNTEIKEDADDSDFEVEEAQILTSSRISVGTSISGRSISPANSDKSSRPALSIQTLPVRSQRSWIQEQSNSSYSRSGDVSRASSVRTQSNLEESRSAEDSRTVSGASTLARSRTSMIPEAEENADYAIRRASLSYTPSAAVASRQESPRVLNFPVPPSERRLEQQKAVRSYGTQQQQSSETKVAAYNVSPESENFSEDELAPLPQKHPKRSPRYFGPQSGTPSPPIPEETTGSPIHETSQIGTSQPSTIGIVSVDRSGMPRDADDAPITSQDQSANRQPHASGSSPASSHKMRAARSSQDSTAARPGDVARNFDDLIQSNETIQYTLTPDSMRELEGSPKTTQSNVPAKGRNRAGSAVTNKTIELMRSTSVTRSSPLYSNPVGMPISEATTESPPRVPTANRARGGMPQARDARVPRESMVEFAEFIRATGPPGADVGPPAPLKRNLSLMTKRSAPSTARSQNMSADYGRPSMSSSISRARLQAREATVETANDKSDLIDFIRRGPPSSGNPHIPRAVAPFRTTMDSDQMASAVGGKAMDATLPDIHDTRYSQASTNVTDLSVTSVQSSINSQSALLGRKQVHGQNSAQFDEEDMIPKRKQRRVRDPYAIDFSDEEEEEDFDDPQPTRRVQPPKEESFLDFLNSEPPPPPSAPVLFNLPRTQSAHGQLMQAPKKKASAPSLISRFRQNSSSGTSGGFKSPTSPSRSQKMFESRSLSSRAGSGTTTASKGYIPIQVNIPSGGDLFPGYGSANSVPPVPKVPASMTSARPGGRVPMKKFEPREAVSVPSRGTSDLADFLRDSSPPPSLGPSYPTGPAEVNSGSRLFGRKKKSTAFA
ncbi:hypothetical protein VP1G_08244 [Cytospora mali]|uniref:Uncharacterized protein n=1 Tax=Cytospora mali TaxID=578113 RepID=A0A194VAX5_CYTMA|nr:hypothetical protein VP1G_08244 [Valsa mali var. pyri (nom. inval.)]